MRNPYEVLQIHTSANDTQVKESYIQKVKEYPPERFPEEFKEIREAYETISTTNSRVAYRLFHLEEPDIPKLTKSLLAGGERKRVSPKRLVEMALKEYQKGIK